MLVRQRLLVCEFEARKARQGTDREKDRSTDGQTVLGLTDRQTRISTTTQ